MKILDKEAGKIYPIFGSDVMNNQKVLYEANLAKVGGYILRGGIIAISVCLAIVLLLCRYFDADKLFPLLLTALFIASIYSMVRRGIRLWKNPGCYRISIDDYGLYIHSDDTETAKSFTIVATDFYRLVRRKILNSESSDDYSHYIETKSGKRHGVDEFFTRYGGLDEAKLFREIADRFHWVEVCEEVMGYQEQQQIFRDLHEERAHEWKSHRGLKRLVMRFKIESSVAREGNRKVRGV